MERRTPIQIALVVVGMIVWGYGQRTNDNRLTWVGIAFFAAAFVLRLMKRRGNDAPADSIEDSGRE